MRILAMVLCAAAMCACAWSEAWAAGAYRYDEGAGIPGVIGFRRAHTVAGGETLYDIARSAGLGIKEISDANRGVDRLMPGAGRRVLLPTRWALPMAEPVGIVINLAEMRLYRFGQDGLVSTYPVGIGVDGAETPEGSFVIGDKLFKPTWYPPESIRLEDPDLPAEVGQGEENPLGEFAMRLSGTDYFIHGTNKPLGVGMRISHGCIRLYPEDIAALFPLVEAGTRVEVVYQPVKIAMRGLDIYMEVHEDYLGRYADLKEHARELARKMGLGGQIDEALMDEALRSHDGLPLMVGRALEDFYAGSNKKPPLE